MSQFSFVTEFMKEFEVEIPATRKCIQRISDDLYHWKPHETSMDKGYLTLLVADIPRWISTMINMGEINFQTFDSVWPGNAAEMLALFDRNIKEAKEALNNLSNDQLTKPFVLRNGDQILINSPQVENLSSTLNHWVHHRGQLTCICASTISRCLPYMAHRGTKIHSDCGGQRFINA